MMLVSRVSPRLVRPRSHRTGLAFAMGLAAVLFSGCVSAPTADANSRVRSTVEQFFEQRAATGFQGVVAVDHAGRAIFESGYGIANPLKGEAFTPETIFDIGSITKNFTSVAILRLAQEGKLKLDDPLDKFLPGVPPDKAGITVLQLLRHRGGLQDNHGKDRDLLSRDEALRRIFAQKLLFAPGSDSSYSNSGYTLLAAIIEEASGRPYLDYVGGLLSEAGLRHTADFSDPRFDQAKVASAILNGERQSSPAFWPGPSWATMGNGEFLSTAADLRAWIRALAGGRIIDATRLEILWPRFRATALGRKTGPSGGGAGGNATLAYYPDRDVIVVVYSNVMGWSISDGRQVDILPAEEARDALEPILAGVLGQAAG